MREDVARFARWMEEAMDSKRVERETRKEPHYASKEYRIDDAIARLQDKTDQLVFWAKEKEGNVDKYDRVKKTAVHLANFCMIIAFKVEQEEED